MRNIYKYTPVLFILLVQGCLPTPPRYPFNDLQNINKQAQQLSYNLKKYIKLWSVGKCSDTIPKSLLPIGYDTSRYRNIRLVKYEDIMPENQWIIRQAHKINFDKLYGSFPDPNCTYLVSPLMYAPFGAKLQIEGEFPYCRFFSIQVSPPLDPLEYRYDKWSGIGEVAIVDADIVPLVGNVNPFLPNAVRDNPNRKYAVTYKMALGNPSSIDSTHKFPYRGNGNVRYGSGIQFQGPWGLNKKYGHGRGLFDFGDVWIRYYGIDKSKFPMAGVKLPKLFFELESGEKFYITADFEGLIEASETTIENRKKGNSDPASYNGSNIGWDKQFGIFLQISTGGSHALYKESSKDKEYIRKLDLGVNGRGENQPPPANYEPHATGSNYTNYLTTGTSIRKGNVFVLTGKLPTFPQEMEQKCLKKQNADIGL
jgi:hypothetical protein